MILDLFRVTGRVAVVTGAGRGLGAGAAVALAQAGADVVISARPETSSGEFTLPMVTGVLRTIRR